VNPPRLILQARLCHVSAFPKKDTVGLKCERSIAERDRSGAIPPPSRRRFAMPGHLPRYFNREVVIEGRAPRGRKGQSSDFAPAAVVDVELHFAGGPHLQEQFLQGVGVLVARVDPLLKRKEGEGFFLQSGQNVFFSCHAQ